MGLLASIFHAWRSWKNAKVTGLLAIAAIALGIGSTCAIYTVVQGVLLKPVPYADPDRYLAVFGKWRQLGNIESGWSYPNCVDFAARATTLDGFGCAAFRNYSLFTGSRPVHAAGAQVTPAFINALGVKPQMGSWFSPSPADLHSAVISNALWRETGSDPAIVGKSVIINAVPYKVAGVAPSWFQFPISWGKIDVWVPLDPTPDERTSRENKYMLAFAKKKPGVSDSQALTDLTRIASQLQREYPDSEQYHTVGIDSLLGKAVEYVRPSLLLLLYAAGALLLIACGNVASLLLARSVGRARETALRVALGASAKQLVLQYIAEGVMVALAGGLVGLLLSVALIKSVLSLAADRIPRADQVHLDWHALAFTLAVALISGVLFSLAPLWQALRISPNRVLTSGVRATASRSSLRLLRTLVVSEIALSFALLTVAIIFIQHIGRLTHVDPGFDPEGVAVFSLYVPPAKYSSDPTRIKYQTSILEAIRRQSGIESVGFSSGPPLNGNSFDILAVPDHRDISKLGLSEAMIKRYDYEFRIVGPDYFATLKIPLRAGRSFTEKDDPDLKIRPEVIVDQTVVSKLWPRENPVGHLLNLGDDKTDYSVIGVVGDVRESLKSASAGHVYISYRSSWISSLATWWVLRSHLPLDTIRREVRQAIGSVDPQQSIGKVQPIVNLVKWSIGRETLQSTVVSFFGAAALLLSMLGLYGVISYSVRQRIPEMGTRFALGATTNRLSGLLLTEAVKTAVIGTIIGLIIVFAYAGVLSTLGIKNFGAGPFFISFATITLCTLLSAGLPSWMIGSIDPARAIGDLPQFLSYRLKRGYSGLSRTLAAFTGNMEAGHNAMEMAILAEISENTRYADSFNDAIHSALTTLTEKLQSPGAALLVRRSADQPFRLLSSSPESSSDWSLPANSLLINRLAHYFPALPLTAADIEVLERWSAEKASERTEEIATIKAIGPSAAIPVAVKDEIAGILFVTPPIGRTAFQPRDMRLLRSVSAQLALMIENSRLTDRIVEQERLKRDIALATEVQQRLFPEHPPEVKAARLAGFCLPARGVGGDYYDFLRLNDHQIGIALADVAGKGIAAALVMSIIQASMRSLAGTDGDEPVRMAAKVNRLLCGSTGPSSYATFFYAKFDETDRTLCYVNGGHNPPFLLRNSGSNHIEELSAGGMIIGMFPQSTFEETQVHLHDGDVFMAFTDGVSEAHNPAEEEFGDDRIKALLRKYADLPVDQLSAEILRELKLWMSDAPQHDDLTFILMKVG